MKIKTLLADFVVWFIISVPVFVILIGLLLRSSFPDEYYRNMAAIRMESSQLIAGHRRISNHFNPNLCRVARHKRFTVEFIDVTCSSEGWEGRDVEFKVYFSNWHSIFDDYYYLKMNN